MPFARIDRNTGKIVEVRDAKPTGAKEGEWVEVAAQAKVGDDAPERDEDHPHGGPPGQNKPQPKA